MPSKKKNNHTYLLERFGIALGDRKRLVATMDVRDGKLQLYGNGFEWEGETSM